MLAWRGSPRVRQTCAPILEAAPGGVRIELAGQVIAQSQAAVRVVGATEAPLYYVPAHHVDMDRLHPSDRQGKSDWGGRIAYFHLIGPEGLIPEAVWFFPEPPPEYRALRSHLAFFPQAVDEAWVGQARVQPYAGAQDGGWVTTDEAMPEPVPVYDPLRAARSAGASR
ncbi:DUF427 domain-containing protein [Flavimaricola marinus]|uniref:DUF427 domain-containing protein n=1 Tax=Flavimaricola marinus TaxID=1819565 RepID=A0A238LC80_9RHOB|nr:DUF427 domain-containing protein [Flavimaricola marinus]SMY06530.1 hypothetical protein LOM8899_00657 [Flavimaricola marinus]